MIDQIDKGVTPAISLHVIDAMQKISCIQNTLLLKLLLKLSYLAMCMKCK